jgi:hypothetical protein
MDLWFLLLLLHFLVSYELADVLSSWNKYLALKGVWILTLVQRTAQLTIISKRFSPVDSLVNLLGDLGKCIHGGGWVCMPLIFLQLLALFSRFVCSSPHISSSLLLFVREESTTAACVVMHEFDFVLACMFVLHNFEIGFYLILPLDLIGNVMWKKVVYIQHGLITHPKKI